MPKKKGRGRIRKDPNRNRYWVKLQDFDAAQFNVRQPQEFRRKEPGLPHKDQTNKTATKEVLVILKIPSVVISQVISNIQAIESLAEKQKIPLSRSDLFMKQVPGSRVVKTESGKSDGNTISVQSKASSSYEYKSPLFFEDPTPSTRANSSAALTRNSDVFKTKATIKVEPQERQPPTAQTPIPGEKHPSEDNFSFFSVKTEPREEMERLEERQLHKVPKLFSDIRHPLHPDLISIKTEPSEETESLHQPHILEIPKPKVAGVKNPPEQNFDNITVKSEPIEVIDSDEEEQLVKVPRPLTNVMHQSGQSLDYIAVKSEQADEKGFLQERQLFLRDGGHYKYGYRDIITGTFDEKLDEKLAKSVSVCTKTQQSDVWSAIYNEEYMDMITKEQFRNIISFREKLPTFKKSADLIDIINNNQVVVISGDTGCGKSTQVPQLILDDAICQNKGANIHILVTQPRRIAASSLALRVAQERAEDLGHSVGYAVRLDQKPSRSHGSIMYVTTGVLLAELEVNQALTKYSHIILDEVHERDYHLDFSMCMLKKVLKKRSDLKLILMSATIDSNRISAYFGNCPLMHIEGLAYPVKPYFLEDVLTMTGFQLGGVYPWQRGRRTPPRKFDKTRDAKYRAEIGPWLASMKNKLNPHVCNTLQDYAIEDINIDLIMALLIHICDGPPGAILVFLTGIAAITKLIKTMECSEMFPQSRYCIYPVHSKLNTLDQNRIFERPPPHMRKIVISTNIAETAITIEDIEYVVDCGMLKLTGLDVEHHLSTLKDEFESKANLIQRRGRAGRCQSGVAFHLLTSYRAQTIPDRHLPELQRSNLLEPVLQVKKLRLGNSQAALKLVPDPPQEITVEKAVKHLQKCGALDDSERLTPLGWHLARLPVHPAAGKLLLLGALFGCVDRAASVAAVWGFKDPFNLVIGMDDKVDAAKRSLALGEPSDHVAISEAIIRWEQLGDNERIQFAYEHFLSNNTLQLLTEMKQQLCDYLRLMGFLAARNVRVAWENRNTDNLCVFKAIVAAALYPNVGMVRWSKSWLIGKQQRIIVTTPEDGKAHVHPSSVMEVIPKPAPAPKIMLCDKPGANWLVYWLKQKSTDLFLFEVTLVFTLPLMFFGELVMSQVENSPDECYMSVSTVKVRCRKETADLLFKLRSFLDQVLTSMVTETSDRSTRHSEFDELVFKAVIDLMTAEDERPEGLEDDSDTEPDRPVIGSNSDFISLNL